MKATLERSHLLKSLGHDRVVERRQHHSHPVQRAGSKSAQGNVGA